MGRVSARMRRSTWRRPSLRALLSAVRSCSPVLLVACLLGIATAAAPAADTPPDPVGGAPAPPTAAPPPEPAMITPNQEVLNEIIVETTEPQFVAPTRRDRIGRIWAPVLIDGNGPHRLGRDTRANRSAITAHTAQLMGVLPSGDGSTVVTGFTGSARVPTIHVRSEEHTSELQSQSNLVCRLLLEKKKHAARLLPSSRSVRGDLPHARRVH